MAGLDPASYRFCPRCGKTLEPQAGGKGAPTRATCTACGFVHYLDPKLAACTIFMVDGGVVLVQRANDPQKGTWVLPGGFVDRGEPVPAAAIRETREEVNLRVGLTGILDVYSFAGEETAVVVYAAHVLSGKLQPGEEAVAAAAFRPEDIPWDALGFQSTRAALRDYLRRFFPRVRTPRSAP
jgi:ADP-ribose pyrophosphatase YjhB (NUDIX family)